MTQESRTLEETARFDDGIVLPILPDYRLITRLVPTTGRRGVMLDVWHAEGPGGLPTTLWIIDPAYSFDVQEDELKDGLLRTRHPNLLTVVGVWRFRETFVMATERPDGTLWDSFLEAKSACLAGIPRDELIAQLSQAAEGVDYLSRTAFDPSDPAGRLHPTAAFASRIRGQDRVSPWSIFQVGGGIKIAAFDPGEWTTPAVGPGARFAWRERASNPMISGRFKAPETREGLVTRHSDQFSLALVYCLLRGVRLPFSANEDVSRTRSVRLIDLTFLPEEERRALAVALLRDFESRWPSNRAFVESLRLETVASGVPGLEENPDVTRRPLSARQLLKHGSARGFAAALVVLAILLFVARSRGYLAGATKVQEPSTAAEFEEPLLGDEGSTGLGPSDGGSDTIEP